MVEPDDQHTRPLRILHVLRAPVGGLFRHVLDLTREQIARGHAVGLITDSTTGGEPAAQVLKELEPKLALGLQRLTMSRYPRPSDLLNTVRVQLAARRLRADVVHGHGSKGGLYGRLPVVPARSSMIRAYTPHGGSFNYSAPPLVQALYMGTERLLAKTSDVLLFESLFIAQQFHRRVGEAEALVRIVHNGLSESEFVPVHADADAADFLYVGELRSAKGIDTLLDAASIIAERTGRAPRLVLVGSGPDRAKLEDHAKARGMLDNVRFAGVLPARKAFALGRILVVPSRAESLPYIVLEAAGARVPMVATNVGGIGEIFGPFRDRLIRCDDPAALADAMLAISELQPAQRRDDAEQLGDYVASRFSIGCMTDSVLNGYRDAQAKRRFNEADRRSITSALNQQDAN